MVTATAVIAAKGGAVLATAGVATNYNLDLDSKTLGFVADELDVFLLVDKNSTYSVKFSPDGATYYDVVADTAIVANTPTPVTVKVGDIYMRLVVTPGSNTTRVNYRVLVREGASGTGSSSGGAGPGAETLALADLTDVTAKTGTGTVVVMQGSPTLTTPTITSLTNTSFGIGTASPGASTIIDLVSTTTGFGLPVMTTTQRDAIGSPREGLLIWNSTTHALNNRTNSAWAAVSGSSFTTSADLADILSDETGFSTGAKAVFNIGPHVSKPVLTTGELAGYTRTVDTFQLKFGYSEYPGYHHHIETIHGDAATDGAFQFWINDGHGGDATALTTILGMTVKGASSTWPGTGTFGGVLTSSNLVLTGSSETRLFQAEFTNGFGVAHTFVAGDQQIRFSGFGAGSYSHFITTTHADFGTPSAWQLRINDGTGGGSTIANANLALHVSNPGSYFQFSLGIGVAPSTGEKFHVSTSGVANAIVAIDSSGDVLLGTATDDTSCMLNLVSTTKGFGLPVMSTTQQNAISGPRTGLVIYNSTTGGIGYYTGAAWKSVVGI